VPANLSEHDECKRLADDLTEREGSVDILVNNAGANWGAPLAEFPDAAWDRVLDLNVKGVFHLTRYLVPALARIPRIEVAPPAGAMYAFFRVDGVTDTLAFCKQLVREARLGLAPGSAFGPEGEGFVRWCFASSQPRLTEGITRLERFLG